MNNEISICYLCGKDLNPDQDSIDKEHVPMKQIYAKSLRRTYNLSNLLTLPTHRLCNQSYQQDEDYFVASLHLSAYSNSGRAVQRDIISRMRHGKWPGFTRQVRSQVSRIVLPDGTGLIHMNASRIARITWKMIRGLFFYETNRFLPEETPNVCKNPIIFWKDKLISGIQSKEDREQFDIICENPSRGNYPSIFDYKYCKVPTKENPDEYIWAWGIWLWDSIALLTFFEDF